MLLCNLRNHLRWLSNWLSLQMLTFKAFQWESVFRNTQPEEVLVQTPDTPGRLTSDHPMVTWKLKLLHNRDPKFYNTSRDKEFRLLFGILNDTFVHHLTIQVVCRARCSLLINDIIK